MATFDDNLREQAAALSPTNAPRGLATCPNCRNRRKVDMPDNDGRWVECTATPIFPEFTGEIRRYAHTINLALFDPAATYSAGLNARSCPLFTPVEGHP